MNREQIYAALFNLVSTCYPFTTASRRLRHWSDVNASEQPAIFQVQKTENVQQSRGRDPKHTMDAELYIYAQAPDDLTSPATVLNPLLDAIEAALAPTGQDLVTANAQTLGGLVSHCWISGKIQTDEGVLGGQAVAIIPIEIVAP